MELNDDRCKGMREVFDETECPKYYNNGYDKGVSVGYDGGYNVGYRDGIMVLCLINALIFFMYILAKLIW